MAGESLIDDKEAVIALNQDQLFKGKDKDGNAITPKYASPYYAKKKEGLNASPGLGTPDLYVTGNYYANFNLRYEQGALVTDAPDVPYAKYIEERYDAEKIYGLSEEHKGNVITDILNPEMPSRIEKQIFP